MTDTQPAKTVRAMDLSREEPRPMDASAGGYPWLPRMIDKARASRAGTLGSYYRFPCPIDSVCLERLGLSPEAFVDLAILAHSDHEVLSRLRDAGANLPEVAAFDPVELNARLHHGGS